MDEAGAMGAAHEIALDVGGARGSGDQYRIARAQAGKSGVIVEEGQDLRRLDHDQPVTRQHGVQDRLIGGRMDDDRAGLGHAPAGNTAEPE